MLAQGNTEDVIYLKSGSIIRGKILPPPAGELPTLEKTKVELLGGSVFVFANGEIDSIKRENVLSNKLREINAITLGATGALETWLSLVLYTVSTLKI